MKPNELKLTQLFLEHHGFVRNCALKTAPMPGLADDIVQQVFLAFIAKADEWELENGARPLLAAMTKNIALQHWRQYVRSLPENVRKIAERMRLTTEQEIDNNAYHDEIDALKDCIEKLPEKGKQLIRQYYFDRLTTADLSQTLDMKPATINRALCRLRNKLGECIQAALRRKDHI